MNIVLFLSGALDLGPFYKDPVPVELIDAGGSSLYEKNYDAWKKHFPGSPLFVIDSSGNRIFSQLCGNSDTLNIPAESVFAKIFIFSAFSCAFSMAPLSLFAPAYLDPSALPDLCGKVEDFLNTPLGSDSLTFFSSPEGLYPMSIELGDAIFRNGGNEIFSIKRFIQGAPEPGKGFLALRSIFTINSFYFKDFLSIANPGLHDRFLLLEKCWKDPADLRDFISSEMRKLNSVHLEEAVIKMEEKFAVALTSSPREIDTLNKLLGILDRDVNGNYTEGETEISGVFDSLVINRSGKKLVLSNMNRSLVLASERGIRVESL